MEIYANYMNLNLTSVSIYDSIIEVNYYYRISTWKFAFSLAFGLCLQVIKLFDKRSVILINWEDIINQKHVSMLIYIISDTL